MADIAERQGERINRLIKEDIIHQKEFANFLGGLRKNINPSITEQEAVEMLSQHIITKPVFEALFEGYSFVKNNPISVSMQTMLNLLEAESIEKDTETLQKFYESVKIRAAGIDNAEGKQRIIIELYDKFFKTAFPKMVEKLGIVYTPVEVVDFIIHSVDHVLQKEFGRTISDENIHVLDPFTGTGTFITRLLQSGLIKPEDLERKYNNEIHANEIVLLAYYIAAINIENTYHDLVQTHSHAQTHSDEIAPHGYQPFDGICLTDTFQLGETNGNEKLFLEMFPQNSERVEAQKRAPLRVIMGNPPYSGGQKTANDNAQNQSYTKLDSRISKTYASNSEAINKNSLYNSYIKAFRWSSDRLDKDGGIIAFVTDGGWIDNNAMNGFRKSVEKEFSAIYIFNLRGNQRTSGELSRKEGGKIFGSGSRTPISITFLVKKPVSQKENALIYYYDIGDYLSREEKLKIINNFGSVGNPEIPWQILNPNEYGDLIGQRNEIFKTFIPVYPDKKFDIKSHSFFLINSSCLQTNRDAWVYNSLKNKVKSNMQQMVKFYNEQVVNYLEAKSKNSQLKIDDFIDTDPKKISWSSSLIPDLARGNYAKFEPEKIFVGFYRPFFKQHLYLGDKMIHRRGQFQEIFPNIEIKNLVICVSGVGGSKCNTTIITNCIPDLNVLDAGTQCLPLYHYEERQKQSPGLFDEVGESEYIRRDGVSDFIFTQARKAYGNMVSKEDIFYYVYGFLHCPEYRLRFANDLKKMLPHIPLVDDDKDFWSFSKAGRRLAELHIKYESVPAYNDVIVSGIENDNFKVDKMRFPKKDQKDTIFYNSNITISNIPAEAYEYIVNGKSAIEWIMERYQITIHKESGIRNDPNDWGTEVGNPRYILDLLLSIINVSVQTVQIVKGLPEVRF